MIRPLSRLLLAVFLVSTAGVFAQSALREAAPLAVAAWRLTLGGALLLLWSNLRPAAAPSPGLALWPVRRRLLFAGVCLALHFLAWFTAMQTVSVARATLLVCTTPLWTTLGAYLWRRRPIPRVFGPALALAGVGVWLVVRQGHAAPVSVRGDLLAVIGAVLFAGYLLALDGLQDSVSTQRQATITTGLAAAILFACLSASDTFTLAYSPGGWLALLGMAFLPQTLGQTLLNASLRHFSASQVAFSLLLEPVFTALLAWGLLRQPVTLLQAAGGALVLAALALVVLPRNVAA